MRRRDPDGHTNILVFYEHAPPHAGTVYNRQCTPGKSYHRPANGPSKCYNHKTNGHRKSGTTNTTGMRQPRSVILVKPERGLHPRQKPVALMEYLIKTYSDEGNTVLDNCMGSGSTGVAAVLLKRGFIGIERDTGVWSEHPSDLPPQMQRWETSIVNSVRMLLFSFSSISVVSTCCVVTLLLGIRD